jgi:hypothetical protein
MITCLTCTGDRKVALELSEKWIKHQTLQPDQWLVVDDGREPFMPSMNCDYVYRNRLPSDGKQTLNANLRFALPYIKGDIIFFWEDDEYYAPKYIETMVANVRGCQAVGIIKSKYYYLPGRTYYVHNTKDHASLAETAITKEFLPKLETMLDGDPFIDLRIWKEVNGNGCLFDDGTQYLYVGMKGMPGRPGIGAGHRGGGRKDFQYEVLKKWMPNDYKFYVDLNLKEKIKC